MPDTVRSWEFWLYNELTAHLRIDSHPGRPLRSIQVLASRVRTESGRVQGRRLQGLQFVSYLFNTLSILCSILTVG